MQFHHVSLKLFSIDTLVYVIDDPYSSLQVTGNVNSESVCGNYYVVSGMTDPMCNNLVFILSCSLMLCYIPTLG